MGSEMCIRDSGMVRDGVDGWLRVGMLKLGTHPTVMISPRLGRVGDGVVEGGGAKIGHR